MQTPAHDQFAKSARVLAESKTGAVIVARTPVFPAYLRPDAAINMHYFQPKRLVIRSIR
jgi:hypothetical protein